MKRQGGIGEWATQGCIFLHACHLDREKPQYSADADQRNFGQSRGNRYNRTGNALRLGPLRFLRMIYHILFLNNTDTKHNCPTFTSMMLRDTQNEPGRFSRIMLALLTRHDRKHRGKRERKRSIQDQCVAV